MTIRRLLAATAAAGAMLAAAPASAQPLGVGTMGQGTSGYSMGAAIAGVLAEHGVRALVQPSSGTSAYMPMIGSGELDFGIANIIETTEAMSGTGAFEGRHLENLRVVAALFPFRVGVFVRNDSDIHTVGDLAGREVTYGFTAQVTLNNVLDGLLASGGVSSGDIVPVLVPNVVVGADDLAAGRAEAAFFAIGSGKVAEVDAAVGGVRFLPIPEGDEALAMMQAVVPEAYVSIVEPGPALAGIREPTPAMSYDYILLAGAHVPDETVAEVVRVLHENRDALVAAFGPFAAFDPDEMYKDVPAAWHDGALEVYRELGQVE